MNDPDGPGLGIAIRIALDSIRENGPDRQQIDQTRSLIRQAADQGGIIIPAVLPEPEETAVYRGIAGEMRLAEQASDGGYNIAGLHIQVDGEQLSFQTKRQPDAFTKKIATACVIATLNMLKYAASIFGWSLDVATAGELITEATEINEAAALEVRAES
jgi:hypothetical protein